MVVMLPAIFSVLNIHFIAKHQLKTKIYNRFRIELKIQWN